MLFLYPWFLDFLRILCFSAPWTCLVDQDSILFLRKSAISSRYALWEMRKSEKYLFFHETEKYLINKVCVKVTQAWKIGNYPIKRKMEDSKIHFFGKLFATMSIIWRIFIRWLGVCLISAWSQNTQNACQKCENMVQKCDKLYQNDV